MPSLDYSVKPFRFLVGQDFDVSAHLDSLQIEAPTQGINSPELITYRGGFQVAWTDQAKQNLVFDDFSPIANPERWRPDRRCILEITDSAGTPHQLTLRIEKYFWHKDGEGIAGVRNGRATVYQLMNAVDRDRPLEELQITVGSGGSPIAGIVPTLISRAFTGATIGTPSISTTGIGGRIDDEISTGNPIRDASDLCDVNWVWLTHEPDEGIKTISGNPLFHDVLFQRPAGTYEYTAVLEGDNTFNTKSIVTGSYQEPVPPPCGGIDPRDDLDDKNRPKIIRTTANAPFIEVFKGSSTSLNQTTKFRKTILYQYGDSLPQDNILSLWTQVSAGMNVPNPLDIQAAITTVPPDGTSGVIATMKIEERPAGSIYNELGTVDTLRIWEITIESERQRLLMRPRGSLGVPIGKTNDLGTVFNLIANPNETIDTESAARPEPSSGALADPNNPTGPRKCLEQKIEPEPRQEAPDYQMETRLVRAECTIAPQGWAPIIPLPLVTNYGFIPSQGHANYLACQIAAKVVRDLQQIEVSMPVPDEWLQAGFPAWFRAHLDDAEWWCTQTRLELDRGSDGSPTMRLSFLASRIGAATPVPAYPVAPPFVPPAADAFAATASASAIDVLIDEAAAPGGQTIFWVTATGGNP